MEHSTINYMNYFPNFFQRLQHFPISYRIAIGNSLIIIFGAIGGTLVTRYLAREAADLWLILLFAAFGITLSVVINFWIIQVSMSPIHDLRKLVDRLQSGISDTDTYLIKNPDPDIKQLADTLISLVEQIEDRSLKLQALSKRAITAQEDERKRIARGLHDDTAQALSMLIINLERLERNLPKDSELVKSNLESARQLATFTLKDLRKTVFGLRPTILDDLGLMAAIRWYARSKLETAAIQVKFEFPEKPLVLNQELDTTLFRIAQEAINNIVRHADAKSATISLKQNEQRVCLWIEDHGRGFDVSQASNQALSLEHLGLLGIQERADLVGGDVKVDSTLGHGTRVRVCVPIPRIGGIQYEKN